MVNPLDHPICLASPKRLTSVKSWHEHIPFGMLLVDLLRPSVLVELGTHAGDSYCAFCQAVKELNLNTRCYAIDTWQGDAHSGFYDARVLEDLCAHHDPLYGSFSSLIRSTFEDALRHFGDGVISLLHVDGYHTYEAVKRDFELWLPKMSADGVVLFHDTNVRERNFGISRFWEEIKQQYSCFEFLHGHGLGVMAVGEIRSQELRAILNASRSEAVRLRNFFFQLGHRLTLKDELQALQSETKEAEDQLTNLQQQEKYLIEQLKQQEEHRGEQNALQLFWTHEGGFSEAHSLDELFHSDNQINQHFLTLPSSACGPLRLDPGNRPAYVEIHQIALYAGSHEGEGELLASWTAANNFDGVIASSGIARLSGRDTFRFICADEDPQLLLELVPERNDSRPWLMLLTLRWWESFQDVLAAEINLFEHEILSSRGQIAEREAQLAVATSRLAEHETAIRALSARLAEREQAFEESRSQLSSNTARFIEQIAEREKDLRQRLDELGRAHDRIQSLDSRVKRLHVDIAARVEQEKERAAETQSLRTALREKELSELALLDDLSSQSSRGKKLLREMSELQARFRTELAGEAGRAEAAAQTIQTLTLQLEALDNELRTQTRLLQGRDNQLQQITSSLGWRLLSQYGRLKHGVLVPAYQSFGRAFEILSRREYHPAIEPIHELFPLEDGGWESTGRDPQFNLSGDWTKGWAEVLLDIEPASEVTGNARLYIDRGGGYSESDSYDLGPPGSENKTLVRLGPEVAALRLDPVESSGRFRVDKLVFRPARGPRAGEPNGNPGATRGAFVLKRFVQFAISRAENFREKNGRAPSLLELPAAMRRTLIAWSESQRHASQSNQQSSTVPSRSPRSRPFPLPAPMEPYDAWLEVNEWNTRRETLLRERLSAIRQPPLLSVVLPVYNPVPEFLEKAIASVATQVYPNWELCIADDASTDPEVRAVLQRWVEREPRVRIVFRKENGHISRATNTAAEIALGDYIVLMDQDDEITRDALGEVALYVAENPDADIVYSDDDKINEHGQRFAPQFKPDWSPELLLSYMYLSHLFVLRRSLYFEARGLRVGYEGSQDYDLALRVSEIANHIGHIPRILYHWRVVPGSTAESGGSKPDSFRAGSQAVQDALDRRGVRAKAYQPDWAEKAKCGIFAQKFPDDGPRLAIIIPTKNNVALLAACINSLEKTTYRDYEVVIVDNDSDEPETVEYLRHTRHRVLHIPNPDERFSFAAINNRAVEQLDAEFVLFLNDDTEVIAPEWLSQMAGYLQIPGVGAVGGRLRFPDGRIQHAGIVHGYYNGMAGPAFKLLPASNHGYLSYTMVARNYSAVTAACLLTSRELFLSLGGFDEHAFPVAYNDVDYCNRLRAAGHRVAYCPEAELIHREGHSRGFEDNPAELAAFRRKYAAPRDPFYNPNLSLAHERFEVDSRTLASDAVKPIRALMCAFTLNREGAPHSQFELTVRLKETGVLDPIIYCPQEGPLLDAYKQQGIRVEVFDHPLSGVHEPAAYDRAIQSFASKIEDWNVDLVYGNTRQTFYAIEAAKRLGLPSIWNLRESEPWQTYFDYLGSEISARALQCFSYPYKVIFVADATRESCSPLNTHHNFITIHNGLDRERFDCALNRHPRDAARTRLNIASTELAILVLGTVCERKGQLDLVEAVAQLPEQSTGKLRCFIVGNRGNDYGARLRSAIEALPVSKRSRIELEEETSSPAMYYAAADVLVFTSRVESFPRVILEAMAAGLPIITTPVFGVVEQVRENINALFYQPGDSGGLADCIDRLLRDQHLRQRLAGNSRQVLDTLNDFQRMTSAYGIAFREAWLSGRSR